MSPKKYTKIDGVMKLNPEYKRWKEAQNEVGTSVLRPNEALPILSNMDDLMDFNDTMASNGDAELPVAESTEATLEMMQEPEISMEAGMPPDDMVDMLGAVMNKYETPMGLMNKLLMLSEFDVLEFIVDDSGSMTLKTDAVGKSMSRWDEARARLKEMIEILAHVPFNAIAVVFLNRRTHVLLRREGRDPQTFFRDACMKVDQLFAKGPCGGTPFCEIMQRSLKAGAGKSVARYFFGDGIPNGGIPAQERIIKMLCDRPNPAGNPITFLSCTNDDQAVEWMKDAEEVVPYCSEADDFHDEANEVLRDQGAALPFSMGFYIVCSLVAAMNPDDLDAMDENVPFTKTTLDNLLGVEHNQEMYRHYFNCFIEAQRNREIESPVDRIKKNQDWDSHYQEFLTAHVSTNMESVIQFKATLLRYQVNQTGH